MLAQEPEVCTACHGALGSRLASENRHAPVEDCSDCHAPHVSSEAKLLHEPQSDTCSECHDVSDEAFGAAHLGIDPAVMNCVRCHDPHASKDPKLFKPTLHAPFAGRACEECHVVGTRPP
jgi:predicted CXXCH cytochrome family protein